MSLPRLGLGRAPLLRHPRVYPVPRWGGLCSDPVLNSGQVNGADHSLNRTVRRRRWRAVRSRPVSLAC